MNRKSRVIVSIVGITIVLLALLGITYAYYLTRIEGNTNTNSISITTADLKLVYRDGNGHVSKENIMPGTTIEKTFTVENTGNNKVDNYAVYLEEIVNTLTRTEDLTYVLECSSTGDELCFGGAGEFPKLATDIVVNSIDTGVTHTYKLTVIYENLETVDQSEDMGSVISGFVQIYAMKDILDIEGEVENAASGDYAQINSVQKRSQIVDGKYKFAGVLPGTHTIKICSKEDTNCTSPKLSQQIVLNVGTEAKVEDNKITMTDNSHSANIDINVSNGNVTIGTEIKEYNPFKEGTLAYNIYKNSKDNKNGTQFLNTPLTTPAEETSYAKNTGETDVIIFHSLSWQLYDTFEELENYGPSAGVLSTICDESMIGKYFFDNDEGFGFGPILGCKNGKMLIEGEKIEYESSLQPMSDDYGISYYYRGNVMDNYVNFAGMCWRIVRIEGDGSIKLILEDAYTECDDFETVNTPEIYTGNWSNGKGYVFGFDDNKRTDFFNYTETNGLQSSFKNFQTNNLTQTDLQKLKVDEWCYDDTISWETNEDEEDYFSNENIHEYYGAYNRIFVNKKPSLNCTGTKLTNFKDGTDMYVGTLTADEIVFAGTVAYFEGNVNFYLINHYTSYNYLNWLSLTPFGFYEEENSDSVYFLREDGGLDYTQVNSSGVGSRPAVTLKVGTIITNGDGTQDNPYVIG